MNNANLFTAPHICLSAIEPETDAASLSAWTSDSRYIPLSDEKPAFSMSKLQAKEMLEAMLKEANEKRTTFWFAIRTTDENELLGMIGLEWVDWANGSVYMALTMKDLDEYSQVSTREAVELMQRYVFHELHMHRLSLNVPEYNTGLIETMTAFGFNVEVRKRETLYRFGKRWDSLHFGRMARDWEAG